MPEQRAKNNEPSSKTYKKNNLILQVSNTKAVYNKVVTLYVYVNELVNLTRYLWVCTVLINRLKEGSIFHFPTSQTLRWSKLN